ncbi:MAG TPA: hypothetical protein VHA73_02860 [Acidimicrobiales bacterium]|jgi:hypothetical protein|nr:hypothetical protein [Acidimicrobiales bacterium]
MTALVAQMSATDLATVLVCVGTAVAVAVLVWAIGSLLRAARRLRAAAERLDRHAEELVAALGDTVAGADAQVDRLDAVLSSAESITGTVDAASRLAYRAVSNPVIKTMALASGTSRAAKRLRGTEPPPGVTSLPAARHSAAARRDARGGPRSTGTARTTRRPKRK